LKAYEEYGGVKEAEWLKFNVRNIISNLYQAEDHARYLIPGMKPEHFSCIIKHLLFVDGELGEAESHASVVNESLIPRIRTIRQRVQRLLDRLEEPISTEADVAQVLRELREIRKEMEKLFPTYDTEECEVCAPPSEGLVEALKEVRMHPSLAELELDYAEKVIKFICDKYGVEPPKLVIDDSCYHPDIAWYDPKTKEIHVCRSGVNIHVLCVKGDTPILGSNKEIKEISVGETYLGMDGKEKRILKKFIREYEGELVEVKVSGLPPVVLTPDHPVLVCRIRRIHKRSRPENIYALSISPPVWKPAKDLAEGDYVLVPRRKDEEEIGYVDLTPYWRRGKNSDLYEEIIRLHKERGYGKRRLAKTFPNLSVNTIQSWLRGVRPRKIRDKKLPLNEETARFFGIYVAEGSVFLRPKNSRVHIALGSHETDLIRWICDFSEKVLRRKPQINDRRKYGSNAVQITIHHSALARFLADNFGKRAKDKKVPEFIKRAPENIVRAFIRGYLEGDGNLNPDGSYDALTVSKRLALDLIELLVKIGVTPRYYREGRGHRIKFSGKIWNGHGTAKRPYSHGKMDENYLYLPIRRVRRYYGREVVYNLETEDHTFAIPFIVHNCHELAHHMGIRDEHEAEAFAIREGVGLELPVAAKALNPPGAMRHSGERSMVSSRDLLVIFGSQHLMKGIELAAEQYTDKTKPLWQRPDFLVSLGFTIGGALGGMYLSEPYATPLALMAGYASTKFWDFALEYMKKEQAAQAALVKAPAPVRVQVAPAPVPAAPSGEIKIV